MPSQNTKKSRSKVKYPGLEKKYNAKVRQEHIDQDYISQLSDKEKQFLSNFNEEYYGGNFNHKGRKFHKSKKSRKQCYDRNNAQNRCAFGISKGVGQLIYGNPVTEHATELEDYADIYDSDPSNIENALIEYIDSKDSED